MEALFRSVITELQIFTTEVQKPNQGTLPQCPPVPERTGAVIIAAALFGSFLGKQKGTKKKENIFSNETSF